MTQIKDKARNTDRTTCNREEMEEELINYNKRYFAKALSSKVFNNKVHKKLANDKIRNKILQGSLDSEECNFPEVY